MHIPFLCMPLALTTFFCVFSDHDRIAGLSVAFAPVLTVFLYIVCAPVFLYIVAWFIVMCASFADEGYPPIRLPIPPHREAHPFNDHPEDSIPHCRHAQGIELFTYGEWLQDRNVRGVRCPRVEACAVCLSDFETTEQICELLACGHAFHRDCIDGWHRNQAMQAVRDAKRWCPKCPMCRAPVDADLFPFERSRQRFRVHPLEPEPEASHGGVYPPFVIRGQMQRLSAFYFLTIFAMAFGFASGWCAR
jgi:hypothetical protein